MHQKYLQTVFNYGQNDHTINQQWISILLSVLYWPILLYFSDYFYERERWAGECLWTGMQPVSLLLSSGSVCVCMNDGPLNDDQLIMMKSYDNFS